MECFFRWFRRFFCLVFALGDHLSALQYHNRFLSVFSIKKTARFSTSGIMKKNKIVDKSVTLKMFQSMLSSQTVFPSSNWK